MPISLLSALKKIWFNREVVSADLADRVFSHYQSVFPWLQDSMLQTLKHKDCPFDEADGVRLIKFIKSMGQSNRTVSLLTTARNVIGKTDSMIEVVRCSQLPETEIKIGITTGATSSVGKKVTVNLLKYYQYTISSAPPSVNKPELLLNLIKDSPPITTSVMSLISYMQSHEEIEARLELFKFLAANPGSDVINLACASSGRGSVGWFDKEQNWNPITQKWYGTGLFTGVISGVSYQVVWDSVSNAKLVLGSVTQFDKIKKDLKPLLKHLGIVSNRLSSNNFLDLNSNRIISANLGECIPVYEKNVVADSSITSGYRIEVNDKCEILLVTDSKNNQIYRGRDKGTARVINLMKVKPRGDTIVKSPDDSEKLSIEYLKDVPGYTYYWINSKSYPIIPALKFVENIAELNRSWAENTLRLRLEMQNIRPAAFLRQTQIEDDDVESVASNDLSGYEEEEIGQFDFDPDEFMESLETNEVIQELEKMEPEDNDGLFSLLEEDQLLIEDFAETRKNADLNQPERKNQFWDGFIDKLKATTGLELISQIMSNSETYKDIEIESLNRYSKALYAIMRGQFLY
jgi:hypothetical protein